MRPHQSEQLQLHTFGGFISGVIGAITSLVAAVVVSPKALTTQILLFIASASVLILFTAYFILLFRRSRRIMNRLGIIDVLERRGTKDKTNKECDWPTTARFRYKYFGLSAVNVLTEDCISRLMENLAPQKLEMMYLDPTCETAIRRMAKHESREPQKITTPEDLKMQIATMLMMAERVKKHPGPQNITLVRHPLVPTFRVSIIDNDIMYLGEYLPGSCGF